MNRKREKRRQITAALLSAVIVFGMCGSELTAYMAMAQEEVQLQERDGAQGQAERTGQEESVGWEERTEQEKGTEQEEITEQKQEDISKVQGKEEREGSGEEKSEQEKEVFAGIDTDIAEPEREEPSEEEKQKSIDETKTLAADDSESEDEWDKYTISFTRGINDLCMISTGNFADGETVEMTVDADSTIKGATLTYEWYKAENKEDPIEKAEKLNEDRPIYTTKKSGIKTEYYICRINDGKNTDDAVFTIKGDYLKVSRYVEDKPKGNSREYLYFDFGTTVKLEVRAEQLNSRYQLAYQWQKENGYGKYQDIEGATDSIYEAKIDDAWDSMYYCDVTLKEGGTVIQTESYGFGLRTKDTLSGTCAIYAGENKYEETLDLDGKEYDWRISGEAGQGETVRLKVSANSSYKEGTIRYTWYNDDWNELVTETAGEYSFVKNSAGTQYLRCRITDGVHERDVRFDIEKTVRIEGIQQVNGKNTNCASLSSPNEECELKVMITSKPKGNGYTYSWERLLDYDEEYEEYEGSEVVAGATGESIKLPKDIVGDNFYHCIVKDGGDEERFLFAVYADSLETYPTVNQEAGASVEVVPGETVTLKVEAKSTYKNDGITYKWYKGWPAGQEVISQDASYTFKTDDIIDDKGNCREDYTCKVSDGFQIEEIRFSAYTEESEEPEKPEKNSIEGIGLIDGNRTPGLSENSYYAAIGEVDYGKSCCLEVQMTSEPKSGAYEYQWGTYNESYGMVRKLSKERTFMAKHVSAYDVGDYWHDGTHFVCEVRDGDEKREFFFRLNPCSLEVGQEINGKTASEIYIAPGETVELSVNAKSSFAPSDNIIYKWDREDTRTKGTAEGNKYTVTKSEKEVQKYVCRVEDGYDTEVFHFTLYSDTLSEPVCMIDGQPASVLQCAEGTKHMLSVNATSSIWDDLIYEWGRIDKNGGREDYIWEGYELEIERKDETETYYCKISDGMATKTVYFHLSTNGEFCKHEFEKIVTQATLKEDGSIVSRCKYCDKVESSAVIPYPKEIRLSSETFTYNGQVQKPTVTVIGSDGKVIDALNYTVSYSEGSKEAGTYTADILFTGNYTGTVSKKYTIKPVQNGTSGTTQKPKPNSVPAAGTVLKDTKTKAAYRVVKAGSTVEYKSAPNKKATSVSIPATVTINHVKYTVTSIAPNAFKNCKKLRKVTVGTKISTIGKQAFFGCKSLKTITVKSKSIKKIGSKAFKGIHKKAVIKVPKAKLKVYKKLLKKGGVGKNVKIKK